MIEWLILIDQSWATVEHSAKQQITLSLSLPDDDLRGLRRSSIGAQMATQHNSHNISFLPFLPSLFSLLLLTYLLSANSHLRASVNYKPTILITFSFFPILFASSRYSRSACAPCFRCSSSLALAMISGSFNMNICCLLFPSTQIPSNRSRCCCARCNQIKMNKSLKYEMRCCV